VATPRQIAAPIQTSDPQEWLAEVLRARFEDVISNRDNALDESQIEGIHQMRVAIRRLRSVIRDFAEISDKFLFEDIRKELSCLAGALGTVRDLDVAVKALERLAPKASDDETAEGIGIIVQRLRDQRVHEFEKLTPHLMPDAMDKLSRRFEKALTTALEQRSLFAASTFVEAKFEIVSNRVDDFLKLADAIYDPHHIRRHHRLRIAAKHLRYAVELFSNVDSAEMNAAAMRIAEMQTHLGDLHDSDVWIDHFQSSLTDKKRRQPIGPEREAAIWLLSRFVRVRTKAYRSALRLWSDWEKSSFLETLRRSAH